jgi:hypothetical protein
MDNRFKHRSIIGEAKITLLVLVIIGWLVQPLNAFAAEGRWWQYQSVDTMKFSRDKAREKMNEPDFVAVIESQLKNIAYTGANYVAIGTPYDEEFYPFLKKWVTIARKNGLKVWFRGNFSGWEGWFDYQKIDRQQHKKLLSDFINNHPELFEDGDIFDPCPEAENGGPGDPRQKGDVEGFRNFVVEEYNLTQKIFTKMDKKIITNFASSNGDVARLVYDKETVKKMGGVVAIDHYVASPEQLIKDIEKIQSTTGAQVVLGEVGAPIPDIHGELNEEQQAKWLDKFLNLLTDSKATAGINYWTNAGSSTGIWKEDGKSKMAVEIIRKYYKPRSIAVKVRDKYGNKINDVEAHYHHKIRTSDDMGEVNLPLTDLASDLTLVKDGYLKLTKTIQPTAVDMTIVVTKSEETLVQKILGLFQWMVNNFLRKN